MTTPIKEPTEQYTYTFAGWEPKVVKAKADATYTATLRKDPQVHHHLAGRRGTDKQCDRHEPDPPDQILLCSGLEATRRAR